MKTQKNWLILVLGCVTLSMTSQSNGAVIVQFEQVGANVVATWTGTLDLGISGRATVLGGGSGANSTLLWALSAGSATSWGSGTAATVDGFGGQITSSTGNAGFYSTFFYAGGSVVSTTINFDTSGVTQTFGGNSLAQIGASSFNNTLAWTSSAGDTVSYTTVVPEPSSSVLVGLGALALTIRRRR